MTTTRPPLFNVVQTTRFSTARSNTLPWLGTAGHEHRREEGLSALLLTGDGREVAARETGFAIKTHQEVLFGHVGIGHNPATVEFPERRCYQGGLTSPGEFLSYGVLFSVHFTFILIQNFR